MEMLRVDMLCVDILCVVDMRCVDMACVKMPCVDMQCEDQRCLACIRHKYACHLYSRGYRITIFAGARRRRGSGALPGSLPREARHYARVCVCGRAFIAINPGGLASSGR